MMFDLLLEKADRLQEGIAEFVESCYGMISPKHIFFFLLAFHWFSTSGCVYNMINNVPPYAETEKGMELLAADGQYSFEGMLSGALTVGSAFAFIVALRSLHDRSKHMRRVWGYLGLGALGCFVILRMYRTKKSQ